MEIVINADKASSIFFEGQFYDTNKPLNVSFSEAIRLGRVANVKGTFDSVPYNPALWKDEKFINFFGDIDLVSGFGGVSYNLIKYSLPKLKIALAGRTSNLKDNDIFLARNRELNQAGAMVWHDQPREAWLYSPFRKNIAIVPWETTLIPRSWVGKINGFDALFTCCEENIKAFKNSGVRIPIELIHWGVEPTRTFPVERPEREIYTFGTLGALSKRKGTDLLVDAFREAFPTEKDVRLECWTSNAGYPFMVNDPRVHVRMTPAETNKELMDWFKDLDCFVFPTRGEGFGLPPLEAMATGLPVIATGWGGILEFMKPEYGRMLGYSMAPATDFTEHLYKEDCGDWTEPNKQDLIDAMRDAYNNRAEWKQKGTLAAQYVKDNWTWDKKIGMYHEALEKHLN